MNSEAAQQILDELRALRAEVTLLRDRLIPAPDTQQRRRKIEPILAETAWPLSMPPIQPGFVIVPHLQRAFRCSESSIRKILKGVVDEGQYQCDTVLSRLESRKLIIPKMQMSHCS